MRGNINTRLRKLDDPDGIYDALIMAEAGLARMDWHDRWEIFFVCGSCVVETI